MSYAAGTSVPVEKSKTELERTLQRYGTTEFMYATQEKKVMVAFKAKKRMVRVVVPMPTLAEFSTNASGKPKAPVRAQSEKDAEHRRRWRPLLLMIKAKLEAVESGIATFEDEFLPYTVMANGQTVADWARPQFDRLSAGGQMPPLLPSPAEQGETK